MKDDDRSQIISNMMLLAQSFKSECSSLCSLIDEEDDIDHVIKFVEVSYHDSMEIMNDIRLIYGNNMDDDSSSDVDFLYRIASALSECIEALADTAKDLVRYDIRKLRDNINSSMTICENVADKIIDIAFEMKKLSKTNYSFKTILESEHLNDDGIKCYDDQMTALFASEKDPVEIIKWVAIYKDFREVFECTGNLMISVTLYIMYVIR